jgi:hypothetical protein
MKLFTVAAYDRCDGSRPDTMGFQSLAASTSTSVGILAPQTCERHSFRALGLNRAAAATIGRQVAPSPFKQVSSWSIEPRVANSNGKRGSERGFIPSFFTRRYAIARASLRHQLSHTCASSRSELRISGLNEVLGSSPEALIRWRRERQAPTKSGYGWRGDPIVEIDSNPSS